MLLLAWQTQQVVEAVGSNTILLITTLGVSLLTALTGGYRFIVNLRKTERGLSRERVRQAGINERRAQYEATLWQSWAADLEYVIRKEVGGNKVPRMPKELAALVAVDESSSPTARQRAIDEIEEDTDQDDRRTGP